VSSGRFTSRPAPRILITVRAPEAAGDPDAARARNARYVDQVRLAGGEPMVLDDTSDAGERANAFRQMDGLLLSGGGDIDPALYGQPVAGAVEIDPARAALELAAWRRAPGRRLPVLGICRGFQAINVFSGGSLVQHLEGHASPTGDDSPRIHPLRLAPGSRLARILRPTDPGRTALSVNSWHHQGLRRENLAPGYYVAGTSPHPQGELVEALESADPDQLVIGVQCHPERTESTPPEFARLWTVFVDACRGAPGTSHPR
jgi:putative glutamine amidotransferase